MNFENKHSYDIGWFDGFVQGAAIGFVGMVVLGICLYIEVNL